MSDITKEIAAHGPPGGFSSEEFNAVARGAELEGIAILCSKFELKPECIGKQTEWKLHYGRKVRSCHFNAVDKSVAAIFEYKVTAKQGRLHALQFVAEYIVFYETPEGVTEAAAMGFCRQVGTFAAYPYFRALFSRFSAEANLSLPPLPVIASTAHIAPKKKKGETKSEQA